jgi:hypothetical protein
MERVDIPTKRSGKFIQILNEAEEREYLILCPKELAKYHANVVERFCLMHSIKGSYYNEKKNYFDIHDPLWDVIGGGDWAINEMTKTLTLSGMSQAYGPFEERGLMEKLSSAPSVSGYSIKIDGR